MPPVPLDHEEILGMAQARDGRRAARIADEAKRLEAAAGTRLPSTDALLRGHPLLGGDIRRDIEGFVEHVSHDLADAEAAASLRRLVEASRLDMRCGVADGAAILEALGACRLSDEADPDGNLRLRCVIYAALLGDIDAAHAVAAEAALSAYVQDWHLEGDGSDLVWQAAAWSALAAARVGPFRPLPYAISKMPSVRGRVDAFADEFRLRVGRVLKELE